ncbi:5-formyltetrahydrofolate cyclo-ligase [Marixanthomonas spongiae]|uniref:5-formyltetrahydrofolate cyclo-ligase n=1 Tax=Marixanthomonas spongiae TaxID=2174845 RepID=A0A2U0I2F8_9FLAO|nr:5-formyltetrahydrofolate cyclo-ligase [Marixanthomonas spongiae]PVW15302.1 5-formyltetrahydrofolate cyclo-ligase [Marixanthomonas spongiae]
MDKAQLRTAYKKRRQALATSEIEELSLQIANQALKLPIWKGTYYHIFLPIESHKEVNTEYLMHILQGKDKSIVVSKSEFKTGELKHFLLQENTVIKLSKFGIPEPVDGIEIPAEKLDVIFVPLLAHDKKGNRIGYGKGFYDRFLAQCNPKAKFVGVSFFPPEKSLPSEKTDIPLHYCITPGKTFRF